MVAQCYKKDKKDVVTCEIITNLLFIGYFFLKKKLNLFEELFYLIIYSIIFQYIISYYHIYLLYLLLTF